jgi:hypothetical protein
MLELSSAGVIMTGMPSGPAQEHCTGPARVLLGSLYWTMVSFICLHTTTIVLKVDTVDLLHADSDA